MSLFHSASARTELLMRTAISPDREVYESCPLCNCDDFTVFRDQRWDGRKDYKPEMFPIIRWMHCSQCEHVFTEGPFKENALQMIFADTNPGQVPGANMEQQRSVWAPTVKEVARYCLSGSWLDIGFGNGALLEVAEEWGFKVHGIDSRSDTVMRMRGRGISAEISDLEHFSQVNELDVVSLFDVLEHMPYPKNALRQVAEILKPDGLIVLSMPNMASSAWRDLDNAGANPYWAEIEHYHNFTRSRLVELLDECEFEFLSFSIPSLRWRLGMEIVARSKKKK